MSRTDIHGNHRTGAACLLLFMVFFTACAAPGQTGSGNPVDPDLFGPNLRSLIAAQQEAIRSGNEEAALVFSRALAMATLHQLTKMDPGDESCRKALSSLPESDRLVTDLPTALILLRAELTSREMAPAVELEKHIVNTHADSVVLRIALSKTMADSDDLDGAVREATRATEIDPNSAEAQIALGMAWWALNEFGYNEQSLRAFTAAQRLDPVGYSGNLSLGLVESQYHLFDRAEEHLRAASSADPSAPEPWYQLGMNAYAQDKLPDAQSALQQYLSLARGKGNPKPAQLRLALLTLDSIADEQGVRPDPEHASLEETLKLQIGPQTNTMAFSPDAGRGVMEATSAHVSSSSQATNDDASQIRATARQVRELAANSLNDWGTALARKHEYAAAVLPFRYAAAEDPALDPVMRNLGFSAFMSGNFDESEQALQKAVAQHGDDLTARAYLGMAQFETGKYSASSETFKPLGSALAAKPLIGTTAAIAFARAGDKRLAAATLSSLDGSDSSPEVRARQATAHLDLGEAGPALQLAQSALAKNPRTSEALRVLGDIDLEKGRAQDAARAFEQESKVIPASSAEFAEVRALLAEALMEDSRRAEAAAVVRDLRHAHPDLERILRTQGELLLKNGDVDAAREKLGAALALHPDAPGLREEFEKAKRLTQLAPQ